jgi:hypothetical protein
MEYKKPIIYSIIISVLSFVLLSMFGSIKYRELRLSDDYWFLIFFLSIIITFIIFNPIYFSRGYWKGLNYTKKGVLIGIIITLIFIIIPSYHAPKSNYDQEKISYEGYNTIIQNCGNNPSDDCLKLLCVGKSYSGFCEGVNRKIDKQCGEGDLAEKICDWRNYVKNEKPNILTLIIPNIVDALELYGMFGIFGLIFLAVPVIFGFAIGKIIDRGNKWI